jgi:hypothetical protein
VKAPEIAAHARPLIRGPLRISSQVGSKHTPWRGMETAVATSSGDLVNGGALSLACYLPLSVIKRKRYQAQRCHCSAPRAHHALER